VISVYLLLYDRFCHIHLDPAEGFVQISVWAIHLDNHDSPDGDSTKQFYDKELV
jgi:hypothetical protein